MIIWIDGPYGVGKTAITEALKGRFGNQKVGHLDSDGLDCSVYEAMLWHGGGCLLQNNLTFLRAFKEEIERKIAEGYAPLIVEMALTQKECIEHLLDPLKARYPIMHIILTASMETISNRISSDPNRNQRFALQHLEKNIAFLDQNYPDAIRIDTEHTPILAICDDIVAAFEAFPKS